MGRKSKQQKEIEDEFELHKSTLYQAANRDMLYCTRYADERLFALLCLCGYPAAAAYRLAFPHSSASASSAAVLASRKLREPEIQRFIQNVLDNYWDGSLVLNESCLKGKPYKRPSWMKPKRKSFEGDAYRSIYNRGRPI